MFIDAAESIICGVDAFQCNLGHCISYRNVCDGVIDCGNVEDERDCPSNKQGELNFSV